MKLATFSKDRQVRVGAVVDDSVVDGGGDHTIPTEMNAFLAAGERAQQAMQRLIESGEYRIPLDQLQLEAPVPNAAKFLAVGLNYRDHIEETGLEWPKYPTFFTKQVSCINRPGGVIHRPRVSTKLDYEGELALVIGKRCRHVLKTQAADVIGGYMVANDVSVRDWQFRSPTWTLGKSFDTHGPIGPWIVTPDELGDPHHLSIKTWLNDQLRQSSNTDQLIFDCFTLVEYLSTVMTLEPGDIISTGTCGGVGVMMTPRGYMKPGDQVKVEIEKIGVLSNRVIEEPI